MTTTQSSLVSRIGNRESKLDNVSVSRTSTTCAMDSSNFGRLDARMSAAQNITAPASTPARSSFGRLASNVVMRIQTPTAKLGCGITPQAQQPAPRDERIATGARWLGSLQRTDSG